MTDTCKCIANIEADLPDHKLDVAIMWSRSANTLTARTFTGLERRDNGKPERRSSMPRLIAHTFCPFCGERYEREKTSDGAVPVLIWSAEHNAYWRPDASGYTVRATAAGIYTREEAEKITRGCDPEKMIELEPLPVGWLRGDAA